LTEINPISELSNQSTVQDGKSHERVCQVKSCIGQQFGVFKAVALLGAEENFFGRHLGPSAICTTPTEGFDTPDLTDVNALLDELA